MKNLLILLALVLYTNINAQQKTADNFVKTYDVKNAQTISIKNNNKNVTIKTWKQSTVQMSTYINETLNKNYAYDAKLRGSTFKINVQLTTNSTSNTNGNNYTNHSDTNDEGATINQAIAMVKNNSTTTARKPKGTTTTSYNSNGNNYSHTYNNSKQDCGCEGSINNMVTITIPENMPIEIENNNGNMEIEDDITDLQLNCNNGNVNALNIKNLQLESSNSNYEFGNIDKAELDVTSCNINTGKVTTLDMDTKFSNYDIASIEVLNIQGSQSDNFDIAEVGTLNGSFSFSTFKILKLNKALNINANSGTIKIKSVAAQVKEINIDGKYSDIDINTKNIAAYNFTAKSIFSTIKTNGKIIETDNDEKEYTDTKGNGKGTAIAVNCNSCTVTVK